MCRNATCGQAEMPLHVDLLPSRSSTQAVHASEEDNFNEREKTDGRSGAAAELLYTGMDHAQLNVVNGGDLSIAMDELQQGRLLRSGSHLKSLPQLANLETHLGRSERLRLWNREVQQTLAAQDPIFGEFWSWSWRSAEVLFAEWRALDRPQRARWSEYRGVPPRYRWCDSFLLQKVEASVPTRFHQDLEHRRRINEKVDVAGLIAQLIIHFQPGGIFEAQELMKKINEPNVCYNVPADLSELRAWESRIRRAKELGITAPDVNIRFVAALSIYRNLFDGKNIPVLTCKMVRSLQ